MLIRQYRYSFFVFLLLLISIFPTKTMGMHDLISLMWIVELIWCDILLSLS